MIDTLFFSLHAIMPILLLIVLGYLVRRFGSWDGDFFKRLNGLGFHLFMPVQLFRNVYDIEHIADVNWRLILYLVASIFLCLGAGVLAARLFVRDHEQKGAIAQATFRSNQVLLGIPLANALGGQTALSFASVATSLGVPLYNILAVLVLTCYNKNKNEDTLLHAMVLRALKNPLVLGAMSGFVVLIIRHFLPQVDGVPVFTIRNQLPSLYTAICDISAVASPLMLFVLGTRLDFRAFSGLLPQISLGVALRLIVSPALVIGIALLLQEPLGLTTAEMPTLVAMFASPVAVSSAVMVQEIGGDEQLANQLVVWSSLFSMFTIFCIVFTLRSLGLL